MEPEDVGRDARGSEERPVVRRLRAAPEGAVVRRRTEESFTTGVLLLLLVVLLWTGSNFLTQFQLTQGYDKPFAVTYLNTSSFVLYLVPFVCAASRRRKQSGTVGGNDTKSIGDRLGFTLPQGSLWRKRSSAYSALPQQIDSEESAQSTRSRVEGTEEVNLGNARQANPESRISSIDGRRPRSPPRRRVLRTFPAEELSPLDMNETFILACKFMIIWFLANFSLNVSLKDTSVASATTLSSTSGFFTLALGSLVGVEKFTWIKLLAVSMSFLGVFLVTQADLASRALEDGTPLNAPVGDLLALASAFFYALYVTLLKKGIVSESRVSMPLFFGFVGALDILLMWPIGLVLHLLGWEMIELPQGGTMWAGVLVNMSITFVSDMAYLLAMLKSSPLVATVGLSLTIPLALFIDLLRGSHSGGVQADLGSILVLTSFVCIGVADRQSEQQDNTTENVHPHRPSRDYDEYHQE